MIPIPEELLEQIERDNVLLFIGERIARDADGQVTVDRLTSRLAQRCGLPDSHDLSFPEVAQLYQDDKGRHALIQLVQDQLEAQGDEPQRVHSLVAGLLQCHVFITTSLTHHLEQAFRAANRPLDVIVGDLDVAFENEKKARLYKLRGALDRPELLTLTEDDHEAFFRNRANLSLVLQGYLARKTILFIGYDLGDPLFKRLYNEVTLPIDNYTRRAYAFGETPSAVVSRWCKRRGIDVIEADTAAFLEALTQQLARRAQPAPSLPAPAPEAHPVTLPERPYKLLDYYEARDAGLFFGRGAETQKLTSLIHAHRLVLLYGASGTGKTSLLLAGAIPRLERAEPPYATITVRAVEDPVAAIRRAAQRRLPDTPLPQEGTLTDLLDAVTRALGCTLIVVLDQFEEFFIRLSPQFRAAFVAELAALYHARDVPAKVVLSLREDWLAAVSEIEEQIPGVFHVRLRLLPLTRAQAQEAIVAPLERLNVTYEPALVARLLDDLAGSEGSAIMPPQLQLVCNALYDSLGPGERQITLAAYQRLGGARGVLRQYLDDELARLESGQRALARATLEELVTAQGTKAVKSGAELALALDVEPSHLDEALERLVEARLLRRLTGDEGQAAYELAHEYLIHEIKIGTEAQARKQIEELVRQELDNWRRFGTPLSGDKLALIDDVRDLLRLDCEAQEFLLRSALQVGHEAEYWSSRVCDAGRRVAILIETAGSRLPMVRQRAAEAMGAQNVPEVTGPLLELAVYDADPVVRAAARRSLRQLREQSATAVGRLLLGMESEERTVRRSALETLAGLPAAGLPWRLRAQIVATRLRLHASRLAAWSLATPPRRAVALTVGLILLLAALAYALAASSYYIDTRSSPIVGEPNVVVIRRGLPWLPLPGLGQEIVEAGFNVSQVAEDARVPVNNRELQAFSFQRSNSYRQWGEDLSLALRWDQSARLLWYLDPERGLERTLEAARLHDNAEWRYWAAQSLGQIALAHPEWATEQTGEALFDLLFDEDSSVRYTAADALGQIALAHPEWATEQTGEALFDLLLDEDSSVRVSAAAALAQMETVRPGSVSGAWVERLEEWLNGEDSTRRAAATVALGQLVAVKPDVTNGQVFDTLVSQMADGNVDLRMSAITAVRQIVTIHPELVSTPVFDALHGRLADENDGIRRNAAVLLARLVQARPEMAAQVADALVVQLADPDNEAVVWEFTEALTNTVAADPELAVHAHAVLVDLLARSEDASSSVNALYALADVAIVDPQLAPQTVQLLLDRLEGQDALALYGMIEPLLRLAAAYPEVAPDIVDAVLHRWLSSYFVIESMPVALATLLGENPTLLTPKRIDALLQLIGEEMDRHQASYLAAPIAAASPAVADEVIEYLTQFLDDSSSDKRLAAAVAFGEIAAAAPTLATPQWLDWLTPLLEDEDRQVRPNAVLALAQIVAGNPHLATDQVIAALTDWLVDEDGQVRQVMTTSLAQYYAYQVLQGEAIDPLLARLVDPHKAVERPVAARALFLIALRDPGRGQEIGGRLVDLSASDEPVERLWANRTRQMIWAAALAQDAAEDPARRQAVRNTLTGAAQIVWRPAYVYTYWIEEDQSFFGHDFDWAAQQALEWLDERVALEADDQTEEAP